MVKIILDTNFLLIPFTMKVDVIEEIKNIMNESYTIYIIDKTLDELNNIITNQKGKDKKAALFALEYINQKQPKIINTEMNENTVDDEILALADKEDIIVATQDKALKEALKKLHRKTIVLRQKTRLSLIS